jgi:hypothetical protein
VDKISDKDVEKNSFMEGLKNFRPTQTIFEVESAAAHKFDSSFMNLKRKVHTSFIEKTKIKKIRTKELESIQASYNDKDLEDTLAISKNKSDSFYEEDTTIEDENNTPMTSTTTTSKKKKNAAYKDEQYYMNSMRQNYHFEKAYLPISSNVLLTFYM